MVSTTEAVLRDRHNPILSFLRRLPGLAVVLMAGFSALGAEQTLNWSEPTSSTALLLNQPRGLAAAAGSGLPVSFRVVRGPAMIVGSTIVATNVGTVEVVAEQLGNAAYSPVAESRVFNRSSILATPLPVPLEAQGVPVTRVVVRGTEAYVGSLFGTLLILDVAHPAPPALRTRYVTGDPIYDIAVEGNLMLIAAGSTVKAYDIANRAMPALVSSFERAGFQQSQRVALGGGIACVAMLGAAQAEVIDYRNPAQPVSLGQLPLASTIVNRITAIGRVFAIANGDGGLRMLDATDPGSLRSIFSDTSVLTATAVGVQAQRLVVANQTGRLAWYDVTNPLQPIMSDALQLPDSWRYNFAGLGIGSRFAVANNRREETLSVFTGGQTASPEFLGTIQNDLSGAGAPVIDVGLVDAGDVAVVARDAGGVGLLALREGVAQTLTFAPLPVVPTGTASILLKATGNTGLPVRFELLSGPATLSEAVLSPTGSGLIRVRAIQDGNAQFLPASEERTIAVADRPVILRQPEPTNVASGATVQLSIEATPQPPPTYQWYQSGFPVSGGNGPTLAVRTSAGIAGLYSVVVANSAGSVTSRLVTVTSGLPSPGLAITPRGMVGGMPLGEGSGATVRFKRRGRHLWLVNGWEAAMRVFDVEDPDRPVQLARLAAAKQDGYSFDLALVDDVALVVERKAGLGIVDVSNPAEPVRIGSLPLPGGLANSITVVDRVAYVGNEDRLTILDVDRPRTPIVLGSLPTRGSANGLHVVRDRILAAEWSLGLSLFDRTAGGSWALVGAFPRAGAPAFGGTAMAVAEGPEGVVYVTDTTRGLRTFDAKIPGLIVEHRRVAGALWGIQRAGPYLVGAAGSGGVRLFDISTATNPVSLGSPVNGGVGLGARLDGNRLIHAGRELRFYDVTFLGMAPVLTSEPEWRRIRPGATVELEARTAGTGPFAYRWFHEGNEISGASGPTLSITGFSAQDEGDYRVEVTGPNGRTEGPIARLLGLPPPRILAGSVRISEERVLQFRVEAHPGQRVGVMASSDLRTWTEQQVLTASEAPLDVRDEGTAASERYFRVEAR